MVASVAKRFGRLDILVNSAGVFIMGVTGDPSVPATAFERQYAVNVSSVAAAAVLHEGGRIVSIGSGVARATPFPGMADYSATKVALVAYTRGWACDFGARGITTNIVQPGPIDTEMNPADGPFAELQKQRMALDRYGRAEEVAAAVAFLVSPEASYISGASLDVDGGLNA